MAVGTGNPFYIDPAKASIKPVLSGIGSMLEGRRNESKRQANADKLMQAYTSGNADDVAGLISDSPELAAQLSSMIGFKDKQTEDNYAETVRLLASTADPEKRAEILTNRIEYVNDRGGNPVQSVMALDQLNKDPEGFEKGLELEYARTQGKQALDTYRGQRGSGGGKGYPSSVKEWQFFNQLQKGDQTKFLNLKRQGYTVKDIGGVPTVVPLIPGEKSVPLSSIEDEMTGRAKIAGAAESEVGSIRGSQQRLNSLRSSKTGRRQSIKKANKFLDLFKNRNMKSGAGRAASKYIPGVYTDQGALDEEFNAFSEVAARQALKAAGETRPTDADVEGMKRAMFGIARDESVNMQLLEDYIEQQEMDEEDMKLLSKGREPLKRIDETTTQTTELSPEEQAELDQLRALKAGQNGR